MNWQNQISVGSSIVVVCLALSCVQKKEEISTRLHDIVPQAQYDTQNNHAFQTDTIDKDSALTHFLPINDLQERQIVWDSVHQNDTIHFLDRFSPIESQKIIYFVGNKTAIFSQWIFADSSKTTNAFLNWMNCFGKNCQTIPLYKEQKIQNKNFIILKNNTNIIEIQSRILPFSEIQKWKKVYLHDKTQQWQIVILQDKHAMAKWFTYENGQEIEY